MKFLLHLTRLLLLFATFTVVFSDCGDGNENSKTGKCFEFINLNKPKPDCCNEKPMTNPCAVTDCQSGLQCVLEHRPVKPPTCGNDDFPLKPTCRAECYKLKCAPYCIPTINADNCPSCYCEQNSSFKNPCLEKDACGNNEECVLEKVVCVKEPCYPVKKCRPICSPEEVCFDNCLPYVDENGCKKCHCCNACVDKKCPDGQKCVLNQVQCFTCPCPAQAKCVKK